MKEQNVNPEIFDIFKNPDMPESHFFRYHVANHLCKGKDVLDASCGFGYGSELLKMMGAKSVTGIDFDEYEGIPYAKEHYPTCSFEVRDLTVNIENDPLESKFDVVVSIETIEHIPRHQVEAYLQNLKKWVKPGGTIFITTPQRRDSFWRFQGGSHLYEYSLEEFLYVLKNNLDGKFSFYGIQEIFVGALTQLVSIVKDNPRESHVMIGVVENVSKS